MIFRIRLPRLEELFGLDSDDTDRNDVSRPKEVGTPTDGGGFYYQLCTCICHDTNYSAGTFYGMFSGY